MYFHFAEMFNDANNENYIDIDNVNSREFLSAFVMAMGNFYNNITKSHYDSVDLVSEYNRITVEFLMQYGKITEGKEDE